MDPHMYASYLMRASCIKSSDNVATMLYLLKTQRDYHVYWVQMIMIGTPVYANTMVSVITEQLAHKQKFKMKWHISADIDVISTAGSRIR